MEVLALKGRVPNEVIESLIQRGIKRFTPPQSAAIGEGLLDGRNMVVAAPTASGKTLIAEIAIMNTILAGGRKAVYIAPMRALVTEKYEEFKKAYPYIKSAMSIGDMDSNDPWLSKFELVFLSTEKFDSLIRHGIDWLNEIGCIVFDEVHMIGDQSRGPTLELLVTKLKSTVEAQIIALSATIGNADEIAGWLNARLVTSDYRPVALRKGVLNSDKIIYVTDSGTDSEKVRSEARLPELKVIEDTLSRGKQALLFYSTKRNAEAGAVRAADFLGERLKPEEKKKLDELADNILGVLQRPTEQCRKLAAVVRKGAAFHHSGLMNQQRWYVEDAFRSGIIKVICSTTTLGLGVNTPAHTVLVRDVSRYNGSSGSERLGVNEVLQLFGRAGRPGYDTEGRALLLARNKENASELIKRYMESKPEPVDSSLGIAPVLRMHILAFIAEDFLNSLDSMREFLAKTFYGYQYGNIRHINDVLEDVLADLEKWEFIRLDGNHYTATRLGKRISELYIDPLSAKWIIESLDRKLDAVGILYTIANTLEMRPYVRATEEAESMYVHYRHMNKSIVMDYEESEMGYYDPIGAFSTALMLNDWISEISEDELIKRYSTTPGGIYSKLTIADWISYAAVEIAKIIRVSLRDISDVRVRLRYGIKDELLDLVRLQQIGRVRARALYNNGIRSVAELRENRQKVEVVIGREVTEKVFEQFLA